MKKMIIVMAMLMATMFGTSSKTFAYPETAVVIDIKNDVVTVETFTGNQFQFTGAEDWMIGDVASMTMFKNGTENVEDDEIIQIKYSGYIE